MGAKKRVLVAFVDALGPAQLDSAPAAFSSFVHRRKLDGVLGYSSGALPTILTGAPPRVHGRMCLFTAHRGQGPSVLAPLRWLGLLPRFVHERAALRRRIAAALAHVHGLTGYVALHRIPPRAFAELDLPEREDMFRAATIGGARSFLADARSAGLNVFSADWRAPEETRQRRTLRALERDPPELAFIYATSLDATMHRLGPEHDAVAACLHGISGHVSRAQAAMARGGADVTTLVVGDHGMAKVMSTTDPRPALARLGSLRYFVDSTMLRVWGSARDVERARGVFESARWPGQFLERPALERRGVPVEGDAYGRALFLLAEGHIFSPSWVGGTVAGMHGYDIGCASTQAALLSDAPMSPECRSLEDVAGLVRRGLGLS